MLTLLKPYSKQNSNTSMCPFKQSLLSRCNIYLVYCWRRDMVYILHLYYLNKF